MQKRSKYLGNELEYLKKVLNSESWTSTGGSWNKYLEDEFAAKFECKYAVTFNSGTSTLHAALLAVGVRPGDEVLSPALTVIMDTSATIHANAIPVYVDVDPCTFNMDPDDLERKITSKSKAIIVVALYGLPCNMNKILEIANKHNLPVIEDNAQCFLGEYGGKLAGTFGEISSYSFENSKHVSCGEGGIITTNSEELAVACRKISNHGFINSTAKEGRTKLNLDVFQDPDYKRHDEIGWNYRLSEFSAAVALAQLERLDSIVDNRIEVANMFLDAIATTKCNFITPQLIPAGYKSSYWSLGLLYEGERLGVTWREFRKKYIENGGDGIYGAWSVPYLEPVMANGNFEKLNPHVYEGVSYEEGLCPVAEEIQKKIMQVKTNYRNLDLAYEKAKTLKKTILQIT
jgi:perosamine synthetase